MDKGGCELNVCTYANCDMVGHTGDIPAAIKAVETVDKCLGEVVEAARRNGIILAVTADHGTAARKVAPDGSPNPAPTTHLDPIVNAAAGELKLHEGKLADIAPTLLQLMGLDKPEQMTGSSLIG